MEVDEVEDPAESSVSASEVPIRLAGRVTDSSRVPITGAEVRMSYLDPLESHFLPSAVSLADGSFVLEAARPGHVELWIWSPRHGESQPVHLFLSPGGRRSGLELGF